MKVFVDTNILLDVLFDRKEFVEKSRLVFDAAVCGNIELALSSISIINACYIGRKYLKPMSRLTELLLEIMEGTTVLSATHRNIEDALKSSWKDTEDAFQYYMALSYGADVIVTRDLKGFEKSEIPVFAPDEIEF